MTGRAIRRPLEGDDTAVGRAVARNGGALTNCCDLGSVAFETLRPQRRLLKSFSPKMERRIAEVRRSERVNCLLPSRVQRLTRRFPHSIPYVATDVTAATLIGSLLSVVGVTIGIGFALLAWELSLDTAWLRLCFLVAFLFASMPTGERVRTDDLQPFERQAERPMNIRA